METHRSTGKLQNGQAACCAGLASVGQQIAVVAVLQQVRELTRSPLWTGAIGPATGVPLLILGLVGGALADAVDRRSLVRAATGGQALAAIGLVVQAAADNRSVTPLLALVAAQAGCAALGAPARRTFPVRLLPADPVSAEVWNYNVGGMRALRHWLNCRAAGLRRRNRQ